MIVNEKAENELGKMKNDEQSLMNNQKQQDIPEKDHEPYQQRY